MVPVNKLVQAGSWHLYCWHLSWAHQKGNYKFTEALLSSSKNAVTLDTMFFSLNPQSIDSLEPIFQKYLKFSFVFFLSFFFKHLLLLYWLCQSLWLCRSQQTVGNSFFFFLFFFYFTILYWFCHTLTLFLNSTCVWLRISADTICHPQNTLVNHKALLYMLIILESWCRGKEHLMLIRMKV